MQNEFDEGDSASDYTVRLADSIRDLEGANQIRCQVFVEEQGYPKGVETDDYDLVSAHFVLSSKEDPEIIVGTIRFLPFPLPTIDLESLKLSDWSKSSPLGGILPSSKIINRYVGNLRLRNSFVDGIDSRNNFPKSLKEDSDGVIKIKFGRVAISKEKRGFKLGEKMLLDCERWFIDGLKEKSRKERLDVKGVEFRASSQHFVVGFYERLGYVAEGDVYVDTGTPHQLVRKVIRF